MNLSAGQLRLLISAPAGMPQRASLCGRHPASAPYVCRDGLWFAGINWRLGAGFVQVGFVDSVRGGARMAWGGPQSGGIGGGDGDDIHGRWSRLLNRSTANPDYREEWYDEQCGGCRFWIALSGELGLDWGACACAHSRFDGRVRFEHDGCEHFSVRDDSAFG
ncbi:MULTISPECIES: DUF3027 domain-containing protein [Streptomyces]|uniref:DUF3027 domain-containing protein n=1 Tax=Streptomyces TaxID=1883 RepID=UPI00278C57FA|nr:DUF3027 domain-containing protein [Streptomyces hydrogenans]